jgi:hypothetical protein
MCRRDRFEASGVGAATVFDFLINEGTPRQKNYG